MKTSLSQQQIDAYRLEGFLHYPEFIDQSELVELKQAVLDAIEKLGTQRVSGNNSDFAENDAFYQKVFTQKLNLWRVDNVVRSYVSRPELGRMLCMLEGIGGIRLWHDQALIKEPFANPTALHLDNPFWSFDSRNAISIWIALEDATLENGCLCFIPGSHSLATFDNAKLGPDFGDLMRIHPKMAKIDPVVLPMKAGDCSFHNGLTAHGAGPNMTRGRRIALSCAYMPDGSRFNGKKNILPESYLANLNFGDLLNDDERNPLVFG